MSIAAVDKKTKAPMTSTYYITVHAITVHAMLPQGSAFYRIVDKFIDQSGANTESVYGGTFKDDPGGLAMKHDRKVCVTLQCAHAIVIVPDQS